MRNFLAATFILTFFVSALSTPAHSQTKEQKREQKVFAAVPQHLRARLIERLNLYVEYERTANYQKLYDLLSEYVVNPGVLSREAYVDASRETIAKGYRGVLLEFRPTGTIDLSQSDERVIRYDIWGEAKVKSEGKVYWKDASIDALWISGEWYFGSVADVIID
ncbi:MAG TPA: hypothetical protein VJT09_00665 [Pyrinomonadaceae bacterium]|nr:hypothetical protein [Pyrinomonadaceae bacterium]